MSILRLVCPESQQWPCLSPISNSLWRVCVRARVRGRAQGLSWLFPFSLWRWGWLWVGDEGGGGRGRCCLSPPWPCVPSLCACYEWRLAVKGTCLLGPGGLLQEWLHFTAASLHSSSVHTSLSSREKSLEKDGITQSHLPPVPAFRPVGTSRIHLP